MRVGGLLRVQAAYYGLTGLWPLVHMPSFEAVTGPKTDDWLVHMVGLLTVTIAVVLWRSSSRVRGPPSAPAVPLLAPLAAASYLAIDVLYVARGVISPVYLLDAVLEAALIAAYAVVAAASRVAQR